MTLALQARKVFKAFKVNKVTLALLDLKEKLDLQALLELKAHHQLWLDLLVLLVLQDRKDYRAILAQLVHREFKVIKDL